MSLNRFASGFTEGLDSGRKLGESIVKGRSAAGVREATDILAEMQNMVPGIGQDAAIPDGQGAGGEAPAGYSGNEWDAVKSRYTKALSKISDPAMLESMMDQMANLERDKVMDYGRMALAAIRSGDMKTAQRYAAGVSYYTNPGVIPQIRVTENGTILAASEGSAPLVMSPDNLEDFLHQYTDFGEWRTFSFDKVKHADLMRHREQTRLDQVATDAARTGIMRDQADADIAVNEARLREYEAMLEPKIERATLEIEKLSKDIEYTDALTKSAIAQAAAAKTKAELETYNEGMDRVAEYYKEAMRIPDSSGGGGDEGPDMGLEGATSDDPAIAMDIERQEEATDVANAYGERFSATAMARRAAIAEVLSDPQTLAHARRVAAALVSSGEDPDTAAAVSLTAVLSGNTDATSAIDVSFDAERASLVITDSNGRATYYRVDPAFSRSMGEIFTPVEQPAPQQGPMPDGSAIPEQPAGR